MRALIVTADRFEDSELIEPLQRLREAGVAVDIASTHAGSFTGKHGHRVEANCSTAGLRCDDYDLLLLPGGQAPAVLRDDPALLQLVRDFVAAAKPVAAICHGPQILAAAGVLAGRRATAYRTVADELRAAGAAFEDRALVVDRGIITSRQPSDLPDFIAAVLRALGRNGEPIRRRDAEPRS